MYGTKIQITGSQYRRIFFFIHWCIWKWWVYFFFFSVCLGKISLTEILFSFVMALCAMDLVILQVIHFPILALEFEPTLNLLLSFWIFFFCYSHTSFVHNLKTIKHAQFFLLLSSTNFIKQSLSFSNTTIETRESFTQLTNYFVNKKFLFILDTGRVVSVQKKI